MSDRKRKFSQKKTFEFSRKSYQNIFFFYWHWHLVWLNQHLNVLTWSATLHALRNWGSGVPLQVTQVKFWSNFDIFWFISLASRSKLKETLQKLQHLATWVKNGYKNKKILALQAGPPPPTSGHGTTSRVSLAPSMYPGQNYISATTTHRFVR